MCCSNFSGVLETWTEFVLKVWPKNSALSICFLSNHKHRCGFPDENTKDWWITSEQTPSLQHGGDIWWKTNYQETKLHQKDLHPVLSPKQFISPLSSFFSKMYHYPSTFIGTWWVNMVTFDSCMHFAIFLIYKHSCSHMHMCPCSCLPGQAVWACYLHVLTCLAV